MVNINEEEAAQDLRSLGLKSCWGCKDGIFLDSEDAFKIVRLIKWLNNWVKPETKRKSFIEVTMILREIFSKIKMEEVKTLDLE